MGLSTVAVKANSKGLVVFSPGAVTAGIQVDKIRGGIVAYTAGLQFDRIFPQLFGGSRGKADINGPAFHVQAFFGNSGTFAAQAGVGLG